MNISYIVFSILLLAFCLTTLVLNAVGMSNWNKLQVPDNVGCMVDFPTKSVKNLSVNINESQNFIQFSDSYPSKGITGFTLSIDVKSQKIPFVIGCQYSMDNQIWVDIPESNIMSRAGVSSQSFGLTVPANYIRVRVVNPGEGIDLNSITLSGEVKTQKEEKDTIKNSYIFLLTLSSVIIVVVGVTFWLRYTRKNAKDKLPEVIP